MIRNVDDMPLADQIAWYKREIELLRQELDAERTINAVAEFTNPNAPDVKLRRDVMFWVRMLRRVTRFESTLRLPGPMSGMGEVEVLMTFTADQADLAPLMELIRRPPGKTF